MNDSPIADDYDQYRLLDGEVVEVQKWHGSVAGVTEPGGAYEDKSGVSVSRLTRPTRLHLQLAGDDDSPGGLLEEVKTGDFIAREDGVSRIGRSVIEAYLAEELATPAELREAGIEPTEVGGEHPEDDASIHCKHCGSDHTEHLRECDKCGDIMCTGCGLSVIPEDVQSNPALSSGSFVCGDCFLPRDLSQATDDVDVSDAANRYVATELQIAALRRLREAVEATERDEYARASVRATAAIGLIDDIIDREPSTDVDDTPSNPFGCCDDPNCGGCRDCPDCGASMGHESGLPKCLPCMFENDFRRADTNNRQPPPTEGHREVAPTLARWLEEVGHDDAADLVRERMHFGEKKYGTRLMTYNGRDPIEDARQELGDAMQYIAQAKMQGLDIEELEHLVSALQDTLTGVPVDTRTCPRCPGTSFTIIETVSRQRFATLDTTGRMHCGEPEDEEVVDRRMRCDCCQYEWRREGWEVTDG